MNGTEKNGLKRMANSLCFFLMLILPACSGNSIYFDLTNQELIACNKRGIEDMTIENLDKEEYFFIELKPHGVKSNNRISFKDIPAAYQIKKNGVLLSNEEFSLSANSIFLVSNYTYGDAASSEIKLLTDNFGYVVEASVTNCD